MSLAHFDHAPVYSSSSRQPGGNPNDDQEQGGLDEARFVAQTFREFVRNFRLSTLHFIYRDCLNNNLNINNRSLEIDINHINQFNSRLYELLLKDPLNIIQIFESVGTELVNEFSIETEAKKFKGSLQIMLINKTKPIGIRELHSKYMNSLVKIEGILLSSSSIRSKASSITIQCRGCKTKIQNIKIPNGIESYPLPKKCPTDQLGREACPFDPYIILPDESHCIDSQIVTIQESPQTVPQGEMPRSMQVYFDRALCDKLAPGNYVLISGIYMIKNTATKDKSGGAVGLRAPYIKATGIEILKDGVAQSVTSSLSAEEETLFKRLALRPDIYTVLANSIAPSIYGNMNIKKSILCLLFGGSRKQMPDTLMRRGDINLLLLGDPGTAKSQLLKFVENCAPIGVYTSGKGSSAAGLTASIVKDSQSNGFTIEGGAMVLADGGVVCIDEFDKMREEDRVAIHEAMEQQTISIAKAGITTTLNTRCSVLAAANSVFGRWDDTKAEKNIDFMPTILSRFDMIYIVKDIFHEKRDTTLAKHIVDIHSVDIENTAQTKDIKLTLDNVNTIQELDINTFRKYVSYCRLNCGPRLSPESAAKLQEKYVTMRNGDQSAKKSENTSGKAGSLAKNLKKTIPITVRQLEALVRIAESLAKMQLAPFTTDEHINEAIRLFHASTLTSAESGQLMGVEGVTSDDDQALLNQIEQQLKKRFIPGSQVPVRSIMTDFSNQNFPEIAINKAISSMIQKREAQLTGNRKMLYRLK